jgi:hypothetical protein
MIQTLNGSTSILEVSSSNLDQALTNITKNLVVCLIPTRKMQGQYFTSSQNCHLYVLYITLKLSEFIQYCMNYLQHR